MFRFGIGFGFGVLTFLFRSRFRSQSKYWFRLITSDNLKIKDKSPLYFSTDYFTNWYSMDVTDPKGAAALASAKIMCPDKEVLTGFEIEGNVDSTKFRYLKSDPLIESSPERFQR